MDDGRAAADPLEPDVLDAGNVGSYVVLRNDQLRSEGFVVAVSSPVEVREQHRGVLIGRDRLQRLACLAGALERGSAQEVGRVPAHALPGETAGERALRDRRGAAEAAGRVDEAALGVVGAAAGQEDRTGGEAADLARIEAEGNPKGS